MAQDGKQAGAKLPRIAPSDDLALHIPPFHVNPRLHEREHLLLWQVRGSSEMHAGGRTARVVAGQAAWIPALTVHSLTVHENSIVLPLLFETARTATTLREFTVVPIEAGLQDTCLALLQAQRTIIRPVPDVERYLLARIESTLAGDDDLPMPDTAAARRIANELRVNPGDDRNLAAWARAAHVSERTLQRAFHTETGMTFQQWRLVARMELASRLLREDVTVVATALRVGYNSHSAFSRVFKAYFGHAPSRSRAEP